VALLTISILSGLTIGSPVMWIILGLVGAACLVVGLMNERRSAG
jgi:hypothetical protein